MKGLIDLHTHILPRMDDGASGMEESLAMAALAARNGTSVIACTSHANGPRAFYRREKEDFLFACDDLQWELDEAGIPIRLVTGMEIYVVPETLEMFEEGLLLPLGDSDYYLIEFPFEESVDRMTEVIRRIREQQKRVIIAHPERYYCVQDTPELSEELRNAGALLQCNGGSLLGQFGKRAACASRAILAAGNYICIGSDAHDVRRRTTDLSGVYRYIEKQHGSELVDQLMKENPQRILKSGIIL